MVAVSGHVLFPAATFWPAGTTGTQQSLAKSAISGGSRPGRYGQADRCGQPWEISLSSQSEAAVDGEANFCRVREPTREQDAQLGGGGGGLSS